MNENVIFGNALTAFNAESQRITVLSEARLKELQGNKIAEETRTVYLQNVLRSLTIRDYEISVKRYRATAHERAVQLAKFETAIADLRKYIKGDLASGLERQATWAGYRVLQPKFPFSLYMGWFNQPCVVEISDLAWKTVGGRPSVPNYELPLTSVGAVVEFQNRHHQYAVVKTGSPMFGVTINAFAELDSAFAALTKSYQDDIAAITAGHYNLWKPTDFVSLEGK